MTLTWRKFQKEYEHLVWAIKTHRIKCQGNKLENEILLTCVMKTTMSPSSMSRFHCLTLCQRRSSTTCTAVVFGHNMVILRSPCFSFRKCVFLQQGIIVEYNATGTTAEETILSQALTFLGPSAVQRSREIVLFFRNWKMVSTTDCTVPPSTAALANSWKKSDPSETTLYQAQ